MKGQVYTQAMALWVQLLAQVVFYAGGRAHEKPRWLVFGGKRWPLEVLQEVEVAGAQAGKPRERLWLVLAETAFFRVRASGERVVVERWEGEQPPKAFADLLA